MNALVKTGFTGIVFWFIFTGCVHFRQVSSSGNNPQAVNKKQRRSAGINSVDTFIPTLLSKYPQFFDTIIQKKDELGIQIIYSQIDRKKKGKIREHNSTKEVFP